MSPLSVTVNIILIGETVGRGLGGGGGGVCGEGGRWWHLGNSLETV